MTLESISTGDIKQSLNQGPCKVVFTKVDGTLRTMFCTTKDDLAEQYQKKTDRVKADNPDVCRVYDLEKKQWRSFRFDAVKEFESNVAYST